MIVSALITRLAADLPRNPREIELYVRRLREAKMFPERTNVRKLPITSGHAASLILAIMAAENAARAAEAVKVYGDLRPDRPAPAKTLIGFLALVLERAHSDRNLRRDINLGTLSVLRDRPIAMWTKHNGDKITFRAASVQPFAGWTFEAHVQGTALVLLSFAIADIPEPQHLI
jgi:hypothetical protein